MSEGSTKNTIKHSNIQSSRRRVMLQLTKHDRASTVACSWDRGGGVVEQESGGGDGDINF